jgi:molybdenum-dependent DNA-binding transcriptional regulator ModE
MTREAALAAVAKFGSQNKAAKAMGVAKKTIWRALHEGEKGQGAVAVRATLARETEQETVKARGFAVGIKTRVSAKKPATTIRARFHTLKRGMAYPEKDLAAEWLVSAETLRRHAQDAGCFRYIEVGSDRWEACVMHPDTAKKYPVE